MLADDEPPSPDSVWPEEHLRVGRLFKPDEPVPFEINRHSGRDYSHLLADGTGWCQFHKSEDEARQCWEKQCQAFLRGERLERAELGERAGQGLESVQRLMSRELLFCRLHRYQFELAAARAARFDLTLTRNESLLLHSLAESFGDVGSMGGGMKVIVDAALEFITGYKEWKKTRAP
jgi:hypothetical protein